MQVTLVFPPFLTEELSEEEKLIDSYKCKAFSSWQKLIENKKGFKEYYHEILPSNSSPISLGQLCLASYLEKNNVSVKYIHGDYYIKGKGYSFEEFLDTVAEESKESNILGVYSMTPSIKYALEILRYVKNRNKDIMTVLGGPHGTYLSKEIINEYEFVDVVSRGEGEHSVYLLTEYVKGSINIDKIDGITYRKDGCAIINPDQQLLNACEIPNPDYSLLPSDFNCLLTVMYARGCPYSCKFCAEGGLWRHKVRFRDAKDVVKDIADICLRKEQLVIHIADSEIDAVPSKLNELLDEIIQKKLDCKFTVNLRCDAYKRLTPALLEKMKKSGIVAYLIGVESASDEMLKIMNRKSTFEDFLKTIDLLNEFECGEILPGIMIGFPGETVESIRYTHEKFVGLLADKKVSYMFPKIFIPYPGSEPFLNPKKYGITVSREYEEYIRFGLSQPFESKCLSRETLKTEMISFYKDIVKTYEELLKKYE